LDPDPDSQSVKTALESESRGYDAGKKVKGRKRHLLVDVLGLVLVAWITTPDVQDRDAAAAVLPLAAEQFPTLQKVWADGAYEGPRVADIAQQNGINVEIVKRTDTTPGFVVQAKRWIVERTLGWQSWSSSWPRTPATPRAPPRLMGRAARAPGRSPRGGGRAGSPDTRSMSEGCCRPRRCSTLSNWSPSSARGVSTG
jgi:transposase